MTGPVKLPIAMEGYTVTELRVVSKASGETTSQQ